MRKNILEVTKIDNYYKATLEKTNKTVAEFHPNEDGEYFIILFSFDNIFDSELFIALARELSIINFSSKLAQKYGISSIKEEIEALFSSLI